LDDKVEEDETRERLKKIAVPANHLSSEMNMVD